MELHETHEPDVPIDWPDGHVNVARDPRTSDPRERLRISDVAVTITDPDADECMLITLGQHRHYLHSTTTRALSDKLHEISGQAVAVTIHGVTHIAGASAARALAAALQRRLEEWNAHAVAKGAMPV